MPDRSIPRSGRTTRPPTMTFGWFVDYGDETVLAGRDGAMWTMDYVSIIQGSWGFDEEGVSKLPRRRKVDLVSGELIVPGDSVLIFFLDGNVERPVVMGGIRAIGANPFLAYSHTRPGNISENALRMRVRPLDADGQPVGRVDVRVADDDLGSVDLRATEGFVLHVGPDPDQAPRLTFRITKDVVTIDRGGTTEAVILGRSLLTELSPALGEIITGLGLIPASSLLTAAFKLKVDNSLASNDGPFLSTRLKTE